MNNDQIQIDAPESGKKVDLLNYKGYFVENADLDIQPKYFEYGAHFQYSELYKNLEILKFQRLIMQKEKKIDKIFLSKQKQISNRKRNNTKNKNIEKEKENNINNIFNRIKFKGKSRNIGKEVEKKLTFIPKFKFKENFSFNKEKKNKSVYNYHVKLNGINYLEFYKSKIDNINFYKIKNGKNSEKRLMKKDNKKNFIHQNYNLLSKNKLKTNQTRNNISNELHFQKSFQAQLKPIALKDKKIIKLNLLSYINPKKNSNFQHKNLHSSSKKEIRRIPEKKSEIIAKPEVFNNKLNSSPFNHFLTSYKSINKINPIRNLKKIKEKNIGDKLKNSSSNKNKVLKITKMKNHIFKNLDKNNNTSLNSAKTFVSFDYKKMDSINSKKLFGKIKSQKHQFSNVNKTLFNEKIKIFSLPGFTPNDSSKNQNQMKTVINTNKTKNLFKVKNSKESLNILYNKNVKNSRNKINNILNNISLLCLKSNISDIYNTQQNMSHTKNFGLNTAKNIYNIHNKKPNIDECLGTSESYSNKNHFAPKFKNFKSTLKTDNSNSFIYKNFKNKKNNNSFLNKMFLNNSYKTISLIGINSKKKTTLNLKKKIDLKKNILKSDSKLDQSNNNKNSLLSSNMNSNNNKDKSKIINKEKEYQNLMNNNNISISIYNNNNKFIYNSIFNDEFKITKKSKNTKIINDDKKRKNETSLIKKIKNIDVMNNNEKMNKNNLKYKINKKKNNVKDIDNNKKK